MTRRARLRAALQRGDSTERSGRPERGDTLIEVLLALIVLSITGVALIVAFNTSLSASVDHRSLAANDVVLRSATETALSLIQQQSGPLYKSCAAPSDYVSANNFGAPNGYAAAITAVEYWNATTATFVTSPCAAGAPELLTLTVTNPNGTQVWTQFVVDDRGQGTTSTFSVSGVTPASLGDNTSATLSLTGTGFVSGATVSFSGTGVTVNSTSFGGATTLNVNVSISNSAPSGTRTITVTDPSGASATSGPIFTVNGSLSVTAVSPTSLAQGATNQSLSLTGTGFKSGATVSFSGTGVTVNSTSFGGATALNVNVSISNSAPSGTRTITVTDPDGSNATSGAIFTVTGKSTVLHVSAMSAGVDGTSKQNWDALVTVNVADSNGNAVAGVAVTGTWDSTTPTATTTCITGASGTCQVDDGVSKNLGASNKSQTFTVTNLALSGYTYNSSANFANPASATANQP